MKTRRAIVGLATVLATYWCAAVEPNLIVNGSFETEAGSGNSNHGTGLPGWVIGSAGGIDIVPNSGPPSTFWDAQDGINSVSLNFFGPESLTQTIGTLAGQLYHLSFYMAAEIYGGPQFRTLQVQWNGNVVGTPSFEYTGQGPTTMGWVKLDFDLLGTGSDTLGFLSTTPDNYGPAIDNVSVVSVPEPGAAALLGLGAAFQICRRRLQTTR